MRTLLKGTAAVLALGTLALQPAEARHYRHHHHHGAGPVIVGTIAALALVAAANQSAYPYGYPVSYSAYPYGPEAPYWNGYRYVYPSYYGGPVRPYWR